MTQTPSRKKAPARKKAAVSRRSRQQARTTGTQRAKAKFLEALRATAIVCEAAKAAGVGRRTVYGWYERDEEFARQWDAAEADAADALEREAWRRAVEGVDKPITYQGAICDTYKEYSDTLLVTMLKARRPEKFKERHEHTGAAGGPLRIVISSDDAEL